jgi:hypothetical protein
VIAALGRTLELYLKVWQLAPVPRRGCKSKTEAVRRMEAAQSNFGNWNRRIEQDAEYLSYARCGRH